MNADEMKDDLNTLTRFSSFLNREIGLCVCETGENFLTFGDETSGHIHCGACNPKVLFHTHPLGRPIPSATDMNSLVKADRDLNGVEYCIGAMVGKKPKVKCFNVSKSKNYLKLGFDL